MYIGIGTGVVAAILCLVVSKAFSIFGYIEFHLHCQVIPRTLKIEWKPDVNNVSKC